jgi:hypothetical protein
LLLLGAEELALAPPLFEADPKSNWKLGCPKDGGAEVPNVPNPPNPPNPSPPVLRSPAAEKEEEVDAAAVAPLDLESLASVQGKSGRE